MIRTRRLAGAARKTRLLIRALASGEIGEPAPKLPENPEPRCPDCGVISIAYLGIAPTGAPAPVAADDAKHAEWFPLDDLPPLAFDHAEIVAQATARLVSHD